MKVGSWVVCVDDANWDPNAHRLFNRLPVKGLVYRIRRFVPDFSGKYNDDGVALEGIFGEWHLFHAKDGRIVYEEVHFFASRFREIEWPPNLEAVLAETEELQMN